MTKTDEDITQPVGVAEADRQETGTTGRRDAPPAALVTRLLGKVIPTPSERLDDAGELSRAARRRAFIGQIGVPIIGLLLIVVFALVAPNFLTSGNIKSIFSEAALPMIVAVGLTVVLSMGEFDLSLNGVAGAMTVLFAVLVVRKGFATVPAIIVVLAAGAAIGASTGVLVGYAGVSALIVTIAVNSLLEGAQFVFSGSSQIFGGFPAGIVSFARGSVAWIPNLMIVAAIVSVVVWLILERTTLGRHVRAVGGNPVAARIAGVNTRRVKLAGFIIVALLTAAAGLLFAAQETDAYPLNGLDVLLPSFAACFIGAAMFKVGEFNVPGTVVGVLITQITSNGLILLNVATYASYFFQGIILLVAVLFARAVASGRRWT